jgi:hypothetical protein
MGWAAMQKFVCFCRHPGESRGPDFQDLDSGFRRNDGRKESDTTHGLRLLRRNACAFAVTPAKAGVQTSRAWIPAFAGMTAMKKVRDSWFQLPSFPA